MKIIHTSDIHIDSPLTARLPMDKIRERRRELIAGFARLVADAKAMGAGAIIIAGDLFDSEKITKRALDTALDTIEGSPEIVFFYLEGNHEGDALMESGRTLPKNLLTFGEGWTYYGAGDLTVAGRTTLSPDMFDTLTLSPDKKNIVILHGELREGASSESVIGLRDLKGKNIDYLALGHYHSYSKTKIEGGGVAVYSGTPEGRGFDECGDKGYVIINTVGGEIDSVFKGFAKRILRRVELDISGFNRQGEIEEGARAALAGISSSDLIRLELVGTHLPEFWMDTDALCEKFSDRYYYFEVKDLSRIRIDPDEYKFDKTLKGEFIRTVSADPDLSDEMKGRIILCGINALMSGDPFDN